MIKVKVSKEKDIIKKISLQGHALYDDYGKDIVCASVSATVLCTINGLLSINEQYLEIVNKKDELIINMLLNDDVSNKLINNMLNCLMSIESDYPKNIKIN